MSPEYFKLFNKNNFNEYEKNKLKSDIFSLGIIFLRIYILLY